MPRFGLRDLEFQLVIPNTRLQENQWLYDLDISKFSIVLSSYFGSIHMGNFKNTKPPFARDSSTNQNGDLVHVIRFLDEFIEGPFVPTDFIDKEHDIELLRRTVGMPNVFMALIYNGDFPLKGDDMEAALFGWTQIGTWVPNNENGNKTWLVPNDVKWYSLQTAKLALALAPLAALADKKVLIDTEYASHFSHLTVEIFNPTSVPVEERLYENFVGKKLPSNFVEELPPALDFDSFRQIVPELPPSGGWVMHQPSILADDDHVKCSETFDIYIDAVRFLPDNATITIAHLNFANSGSIHAPENMLFLSHLESAARSPYYNGRVVVNDRNKQPADEMVAILSIITVDRVSLKATTLGTAIIPLFRKMGQDLILRKGGHQCRLYQCLPPEPNKRTNILEPERIDAIRNGPFIPACTVLVRLARHEDEFADVPLYSSGFYQSDDCEPTQDEEAIMLVAMEDDRTAAETGELGRAATVRDACNFLMKQKGEKPPGDQSPAGLAKWMQQRIIRQGSFTDQILPPYDYLNYSQMAGVAVKFQQFSMPSNNPESNPYSKIIFGRAQLFPFSDVRTAQGTADELFVLEPDLDCVPDQHFRWKDPSQTLYPTFNKSVVLLVSFYHLKVEYATPVGTVDKEMVRQGALRSLTRATLSPEDMETVGWAVVPLFKSIASYQSK